MVLLAYSTADTVSSNSAEALKSRFGLAEAEPVHGLKRFRGEGIDLVELPTTHLNADFLDSAIETDCIIFLSRHSSTTGQPAFTAHPEGNWSGEAKLGGKPKQLGVAAPLQMLRVLLSMKKYNTTSIPITYEATHHGPLLHTPSLYAELGGNEEMWASREMAGVLAESVVDSMDSDANCDKIALGVGGLHYAGKFTKLAMDGKYAFAHIMPRHNVGQVDMLGQAVSRSSPATEIAVIEWKSITAPERNAVIARLDELGLDHVRV